VLALPRALSVGLCIALFAVAAPAVASAKGGGGDAASEASVVVVKRFGPVAATWYGPGFFGHRTGCGGRLRSSTWGIAHRTLPCGTLVRLRFGGRTTVVPVVDRGPYSGATIDITQRAASYLNFTQVGTGRVRMDVVRRVHHHHHKHHH
jgi:hypothetical protein